MFTKRMFTNILTEGLTQFKHFKFRNALEIVLRLEKINLNKLYNLGIVKIKKWYLKGSTKIKPLIIIEV